MTAITHSTIEVTRPGDLLRRFECACGFVLETTEHGVGPRIVAAGDPVRHTGGWLDQLAHH